MVLLLASISLSGCARIIGQQDTEFYRADSFLKEKKYSEAITAYRSIAKGESAKTERAANAQFALASALAYYDNPERDYTLALQEFDEFLKLYPDDEKAHEARQWRSLLKLIIELKKENDLLNKNIEHLNKSIEQLKQLDIRHEERRRK
jgi:outer membrane protein assembly factor BamD (BamD/ComL family)